MGNYSVRRREDDEVVQAESSASTSQVVGRTRQSRSNAVYEAPPQRGNAFRGSEPTAVTRGRAGSALDTEAKVMTVDEYERRQENERLLTGSGMVDFETALAARYQHRLAGDANPDADDLLGYLALGQSPLEDQGDINQRDEFGGALDVPTNPLHAGGEADQQSQVDDVVIGPEDEVLPEEVAAADRAGGNQLKTLKKLPPFKRRVRGLVSELKNFYQAFKDGLHGDDDSKASGWRAAWTGLYSTAKAVKAALGSGLATAAKWLPIVGAAFSAIDFVDQMKNTMLPLREIRDQQSLQLFYERTEDPEKRDQNKITALTTLQKNINYEMWHTLTSLSLTATAFFAHIATIFGGAYGYLVAAGAMAVNLLREGAKFLWDLFKKSSAASAEDNNERYAAAVEEKQANLEALEASIGPNPTPEQREQLDIANRDLEKTRSRFEEVHTVMLQKSNHAAFVEVVQGVFAPVKEGLATDIAPEDRLLLKSYGVSEQFISNALEEAKAHQPVSNSVIDIALDDISHFLAWGKPQGLFATIGEFFTKVGRMVTRRWKTLTGTHEWQPLDELELRKVVHTKLEPFKEYILKKVKHRNQPIADDHDSTGNAKLRSCIEDLATRLRRDVDTEHLAEAKPRFIQAEHLAEEYVQRWLQHAFEKGAVFKADVDTEATPKVTIHMSPGKGESAGFEFMRKSTSLLDEDMDDRVRG